MAQGHDTHESAVGTYVLIAIILAIITYLEFAIVEYEIAWLDTTWTYLLLIGMSVAKFILVILFFMHLKDDERIYSGFFGSGLGIALGTFVALAFLFLLPRSVAFVQAQGVSGEEVHAEAEGHHGALTAEEAELIVSDGYSRPLIEVLDVPRPKNQRFELVLPLAEAPVFTLQPLVLTFGSPTETTDTTDTADTTDTTDTTDTADTTDTTATDGGDAPQAQAPTFDAELGTQVYNANCVSCHQTDGAGLAGVFPPLAQHMPALYVGEGGREYLIHTLLYGLQGQIQALGQNYNGVMPAWPQLSDEQIAAVLNHELTSWDNAELLPEDFGFYTAEDIAAQRGLGLAPTDVLEQRPEVP